MKRLAILTGLIILAMPAAARAAGAGFGPPQGEFKNICQVIADGGTGWTPARYGAGQLQNSDVVSCTSSAYRVNLRICLQEYTQAGWQTAYCDPWLGWQSSNPAGYGDITSGETSPYTYRTQAQGEVNYQGVNYFGNDYSYEYTCGC